MDDEADGGKIDSSKIYKVKYQLNLLPQLGTYVNKSIDPFTQEISWELANDDINFLELCCNNEDELHMFESESL